MKFLILASKMAIYPVDLQPFPPFHLAVSTLKCFRFLAFTAVPFLRLSLPLNHFITSQTAFL
ncbi:hypothetical protein ACQP3F_29530, partial [Escherichia coli]